MDAILDKLTEIENAASAIVRHAEEQKDVLGQEFDEKRKKFDEDLENKTKARLEKIREQLEKEQSRVLNSSSGASEDTIRSLRKEYEEKHTEYAHEILRRITEV
ncbi:hypothetical protein [[Ruminococcus] torques]|uniref:hypothetical protein n=1 Tax=[Ruminococcus] torques TaxID=33039 RepID=UPI00242B2683|nr:hypothetical protein [[Ruminococcus] torques]